MRRLYFLAACFLTGCITSSLLSLWILSQPWQTWAIASLIILAIAYIGWNLDDAIANWLDLELIEYYGGFWMAIACVITGIGAVIWTLLGSLG
jgi:hypothetical protein